MATHWYVLRSKPHKENTAWKYVQSQDFDGEVELYYPRLHVDPVNPRARKIRPFLPGYLFVRTDLDEVGLSTFQWMPFTNGLVCFGGVPAVVPEEIVAAIERHVAAINEVGGEFYYELEPGDLVEITDGPFAGYRAIFDMRLSGRDRVRVFLEMLEGQAMRVELHASQIEKV